MPTKLFSFSDYDSYMTSRASGDISTTLGTAMGSSASVVSVTCISSVAGIGTIIDSVNVMKDRKHGVPGDVLVYART